MTTGRGRHWRYVAAAVALALLTSACTDPSPGQAVAGKLPPKPTRDLIVAADGLCVATAAIRQAVSELPDPDSPADPQFSSAADEASTYLRSNATLADRLEVDKQADGPPAVKQLVADLAASLAEVRKSAAGLVDYTATPGKRTITSAARLAELFGGVKPTYGDVVAATRESPELAVGYRLAPSCPPIAPPPVKPAARSMPAAADGTDLAACADGACEVSVTRAADLYLGDQAGGIQVGDGVVSVWTGDDVGRADLTLLEPGSKGELARPGASTVLVELRGHRDDTAVLKLAVLESSQEKPERPRFPTRELMAAMGEVCDATSSVRDAVQAGKELSQPSGGVPLGMFAAGYVSSSAGLPASYHDALSRQGKLGLPAADQLVSGLVGSLGAVKSAASRMEAAARESSFGGPDPKAVGRARKLTSLLDKVRPTAAQLPAITGSDRVLAEVYRLTPACAPEQEADVKLPTAKDGTKLSACADGRCEVKVTGRKSMRIAGATVVVSVALGSVMFEQSYGNGGGSTIMMGPGGTASWSTAGSSRTTEAKVLGVRNKTAVLVISTA